jgi:ElaB/YqjD/DUF883 family membrane-anchored ribosome-binding protein
MSRNTKNLRNRASSIAGRLTAHDSAPSRVAHATREKAGPAISDAINKTRPAVSDAIDKARPVLADAIDKAGPALSDARDKAGPALADARERIVKDVVPAVTAAVAAANEASAPVREETKRRGVAAVAALKGEVGAPAPKRHRVRKALIVLGLGGIIAAVVKKLTGGGGAEWQSSYTPPAPGPVRVDTDEVGGGAGGTGSHRAEPTPVTPAAPPAGAEGDEAAATPDVAAADAEAEPHAPTTPDAPLEETTLDETKVEE